MERSRSLRLHKYNPQCSVLSGRHLVRKAAASTSNTNVQVVVVTLPPRVCFITKPQTHYVVYVRDGEGVGACLLCEDVATVVKDKEARPEDVSTLDSDEYNDTLRT